jgi:hypothetical protein
MTYEEKNVPHDAILPKAGLREASGPATSLPCRQSSLLRALVRDSQRGLKAKADALGREVSDYRSGSCIMCGRVKPTKWLGQHFDLSKALAFRLTCPPKTDPHVKLDWWIKRNREMSSKRFAREQVIGKPRETKVTITAMILDLSGSQKPSISRSYLQFSALKR